MNDASGLMPIIAISARRMQRSLWAAVILDNCRVLNCRSGLQRINGSCHKGLRQKRSKMVCRAPAPCPPAPPAPAGGSQCTESDSRFAGATRSLATSFLAVYHVSHRESSCAEAIAG
jgi:hypothetical protein